MNVIPVLEPTSILDIGEYLNVNPKAEMGMLCVISKFCALFSHWLWSCPQNKILQVLYSRGLTEVSAI